MEDIRLEKVWKAFHGVPVLRELSAVFPAGEVSCIMAPSGTGKTTLLRILMGLERADAGQITGLAGRKLSVVFQEDRLCPWLTALDNILLVSPDLDRGEAEAALDELGLSGCAGQPIRELSGGMCRRVALLRALLADCDVLLLDEPFKGLDAGTKASVIQVVRRRAAGKTVLLVTHDPEEGAAMGAGQVLTLPPVKGDR